MFFSGTHITLVDANGQHLAQFNEAVSKIGDNITSTFDSWSSNPTIAMTLVDGLDQVKVQIEENETGLESEVKKLEIA